jgi:hypothetical protein
MKINLPEFKNTIKHKQIKNEFDPSILIKLKINHKIKT